MRVTVVDHALALHHLTIVRDRRTAPVQFRHSLAQLATFVAIEATGRMELEDFQVQTPLTTTDGKRIARRVGLVLILRAGVIMVVPVLDLIPDAEVWHLGVYRDEATAQPVPYYNKLPAGSPVDVALVLDPMLATGGSACMACESMRDWGVDRTVLVSVIAAPEGIARVNREFPDTALYTCAVDEKLNDDKFIVPGLGDAGDRVFNTL
jgi:uracil phosphoribosyltransferase